MVQKMPELTEPCLYASKEAEKSLRMYHSTIGRKEKAVCMG